MGDLQSPGEDLARAARARLDSVYEYLVDDELAWLFDFVAAPLGLVGFPVPRRPAAATPSPRH